MGQGGLMSAVNSNSDDRDLEAIRRAQRAHEPSMEEILASIRNIIAEEREPAKPIAAPNQRRRPPAPHRRDPDRLFQGGARRRTADAPEPAPARPRPIARRSSGASREPATPVSAEDAVPPDEEPLAVVGGERSGDVVVRRLVGQSCGRKERRTRRRPGARDAASDAQGSGSTRTCRRWLSGWFGRKSSGVARGRK